MEPFHDRMPVIIPRHEYDRWLGAENGKVQGSEGDRLPLDLLRPFPAEEMTAWRVGDEVGNVRNNTPELIEPLTPEQLAAEPSKPKPATPKKTNPTKSSNNDGGTQGNLFG
jgi:hypothetical protein